MISTAMSNGNKKIQFPSKKVLMDIACKTPSCHDNVCPEIGFAFPNARLFDHLNIIQGTRTTAIDTKCHTTDFTVSLREIRPSRCSINSPTHRRRMIGGRYKIIDSFFVNTSNPVAIALIRR